MDASKSNQCKRANTIKLQLFALIFPLPFTQMERKRSKCNCKRQRYWKVIQMTKSIASLLPSQKPFFTRCSTAIAVPAVSTVCLLTHHTLTHSLTSLPSNYYLLILVKQPHRTRRWSPWGSLLLLLLNLFIVPKRYYCGWNELYVLRLLTYIFCKSCIFAVALRNFCCFFSILKYTSNVSETLSVDMKFVSVGRRRRQWRQTSSPS